MLLSACSAPSATGVPVLDAARLSEPKLEGLAPRRVALKFLDERTPLPETTRETLAEVERAVDARYRRSGIEVDPSAPNAIVFKIRYKEPPLRGYEREDCLWIVAKLTTPKGWAEAEGGACFEVRNLYGMDLGGDASQAFETALSGAIDMLDRSWFKARGLESE